jgi:U5 small nuclear ribonucleoprotein component
MVDINDDDDDLYDEFGNYIGPALESSEDEIDEDELLSSSEEEEENEEDAGDDGFRSGDALVIELDGTSTEDQQGRDSTTVAAANMIVLHEDKVHYPSAEEVYGDFVRTVVLDEDAMELEEPIVKPMKTKVISMITTTTTRKTGSEEGPTLGTPSGDGAAAATNLDFLTSNLLANTTTNTRRGIAVCGHLHSGKTSLLDMLLLEQQQQQQQPQQGTAQNHLHAAANGDGPRFTDTLVAEQERKLSLKSTPLTLALPDTRGKHYAITFLDCPGHTQFHDESVAAMRAVDGVLLVVDALEGANTLHMEMLLSHALSEGLHMLLCINKVDRLIVDLKLPPSDAYYKLLHTVDSMNALLHEKAGSKRLLLPQPYFAPERGNVCFASAQHGWSFTLLTMAQHYADYASWDTTNTTYGSIQSSLGQNLTVQDFAQRLWGECYLDETTRTFHKRVSDCTTNTTVDGTPLSRTFVKYILEPLYKLYALCLGEEEDTVEKVLRDELGIYGKRNQLRGSSCARPLLRSVCQQFFGPSTGLVDMIVNFIPSPKRAAKGKITRGYTGPLNSLVAKSMMECNSRGPLMVHVVKLYPTSNGQSFSAFGRIYSGSIQPGDSVHVLGESYSFPDDDEDVMTATVSAICIPQGRSMTEVSRATAGNWVLIEGIDSAIAKTATLTDNRFPHPKDGNGEDEYENDEEDAVQIFSPLSFPQCGFESTMKLAVEPLNPAELPKMVEGLRRITKSYPMAKTRVEESGEHVLFGTGELYLDCIMHDLRHVYADIEIKVADPVVGFRETVVETSSLQCFADTPNKRNRVTLVAEPLTEGLAESLEAGKIDIIRWDNKKLGRYFQTQYDWDLLSSRSVWAFGPSPTRGTNILLDDTLPSEVDKDLLQTCKSSIVQGFQWAVREGPLCEEPVRSTQVKLLDIVLADQSIHRGGGQIIPTVRRTVHSAILTATPRIMEPVYQLQIHCRPHLVDAIQPLIAKRRGHVVQDKPIAGTALCIVKAYMPVIDSFGFETDIRTYTQGQAMVHSVLDHWAIVPGDPLDSTVVLHPLEPSPTKHLAREFIIKTRRRKGLPEDVSISRYFDEEMKALLLAQQEQ